MTNHKNKPQMNTDEHIQNVYDEGELVPEATIRKFRIVQMEGKREVARMVDFYNLDMIISVGYRVKSHLNNLVEQYLIFAQGQAMRRIPMYMNDWIKKLDSFMTLNDRDILTHVGKISHEIAKQLAEGEYDKFHTKRLSDSAKSLSDFDKAVKKIDDTSMKKPRRSKKKSEDV